MRTTDVFQSLIEAVETVYRGHAGLSGFAPFPGDIRRQPVEAYHCPCSDLFQQDQALVPGRYADLHKAILEASSAAQWRETYKNTDIGADFMDRFGCYCIVGEGGPFMSDHLRLYMVYMPAGLYYPWHHHPAEEIYMVVSGAAVFRKEGAEDLRLTEGQIALHASNQPHATETFEEPVLCLVAWRDQFETPPVLTEGYEALARR